MVSQQISVIFSGFAGISQEHRSSNKISQVTHIRSTLTPLLLHLEKILNNPQRRLPEEQREMFYKNDWEIIDAAQPAHNAPPPFVIPQYGLSMNVLSFRSKRLFVWKNQKFFKQSRWIS